MNGIVAEPQPLVQPLITIRVAPTIVTHAVRAIRPVLYAMVVVFAVLDITIAVLVLVAIWAWSQLTKGTQS